MGLLFAVLQVAASVRVAVADVLGLELERHLEERVMRAAMSPPHIGHLEDPRTLDQISSARSVGTSGYRVGEAVAAMASRSATRIQGYTSALLVFSFRWWVALGLLATWAWAGREQRRSVLDTTRTLARRSVLDTTRTLARRNELVRRSEYLRDLAVTPAAAKEVRVFGLSGWLVDRFRGETLRVLTEVWRQRARTRWQWVVSTLSAAAASFLALLLLGLAAAYGEVGLGALGLYAGAVLGVMALVHMGPDNHRVEYGTTAVPAVVAVEALTAQAAPATGLRPPPPDSPREEVRFEDVTFSYPASRTNAVSHLDLLIPAGRSTAIVGANGAGKTTLVKLLCGFYQPDRGRITIDGDCLAELDPGLWQRRIAALFQDFVHYPMSAYDNISFGSLARAGDAAAVAAAARRAGALPTIATLDAGFETLLTSTRSGGTDLSGGQWQRVGLARALFAVKGGARLLILDEPAANLDVRAEAELYERFLDLTHGLTTVVISHRFSTVRQAERIVVLEGGRVAEQGSHDELLAADGLYARMFRLQVARLARGQDA